MLISSWGLAGNYTQAGCTALILLFFLGVILYLTSLQPQELRRKKDEPLSPIICKTLESNPLLEH